MGNLAYQLVSQISEPSTGTLRDVEAPPTPNQFFSAIQQKFHENTSPPVQSVKHLRDFRGVLFPGRPENPTPPVWQKANCRLSVFLEDREGLSGIYRQEQVNDSHRFLRVLSSNMFPAPKWLQMTCWVEVDSLQKTTKHPHPRLTFNVWSDGFVMGTLTSLACTMSMVHTLPTMD